MSDLYRYESDTIQAAAAAAVPVEDALQLRGMALACELADAWCDALTGPKTAVLTDLLDRLEIATRGSAMRKVQRP